MILLSGFGQAVSRESIIQGLLKFAVRSMEGSGCTTRPCTVRPDYYAKVVQGVTEHANSLGAQHGYSYTEAEFDAALKAIGYIPGTPGGLPEDLDIGGAPIVVNEGIDSALRRRGMSLTASWSPELIESELFLSLTQEVIDSSRARGIAVTQLQAGLAIQERGYFPTERPQLIIPELEDVEIPATFPVIVDRPPVEVINMTVTAPQPEFHILPVPFEPAPEPWTYQPQPEPTPAAAPAAGGLSTNVVLIGIAAIGGFLLATQSGGRNGAQR